MNENTRSKALLQKVYDYLDSIDVSTLSMRELQDFLEVVQKGQFLETVGKMPAAFPFSAFGGNTVQPTSNVGANTAQTPNNIGANTSEEK